jgi:hypothetical protein
MRSGVQTLLQLLRMSSSNMSTEFASPTLTGPTSSSRWTCLLWRTSSRIVSSGGCQAIQWRCPIKLVRINKYIVFAPNYYTIYTLIASRRRSNQSKKGRPPAKADSDVGGRALSKNKKRSVDAIINLDNEAANEGDDDEDDEYEYEDEYDNENEEDKDDRTPH